MKICIHFVCLLMLVGCKTAEIETDICVYGGTSAGVIAAYSSHQLGKSAILIEPSSHFGGLSSGGLGATDIGNKYAVTGISRDFYRKTGSYYGKFEMWTFEPHVAEKIFNEYLDNTNVRVLKEYRLKKVIKKDARIREIVLENAKSPFWKNKIKIKAKMFIDCSYEGDLMANSGVSYTVGRESNSQYNETLNGVQLLDKHQFPDSIDPYIEPGNHASGLLYGITPAPLQPTGTGDKLVQAYNFRLCLTQDTGNMIPITAPDNYKNSHYELLKRLLENRERKGWKHVLNSYLLIKEMPGNKTDMNNMGPFSTDFINENWNYPEADYNTREEITMAHENYCKGFLYFLGNDESVPAELRKQMLSWGYARDEFRDNGGFPHQLYVREARRMIGEYVMTENNCRGVDTVTDAVGLAAYTMDSHNCQRIVVNGMVKNEGDVQVGGFPPYPISYRSITPKRSECSNLLVPVCLSSTHISYGSIRMEPVFMVLGQSSAIAASLAIEQNSVIQDIDVKALQNIIQNNPYLDGRSPEIMIDNSNTEHIKTEGNWITSNQWMGQIKNDCLIKQGDQTGKYRVKLFPELDPAENYSVYYYCPAQGKKMGELTSALPVLIFNGTETLYITIDLLSNQNSWIFLGDFTQSENEPSYLEVRADTVSHSVAFDAVLWIPKTKKNE